MLLSLDIDTYSPARDALAILPYPPLPPQPSRASSGLQLRVGFEMAYQCPAPTPMLLALSIHYTRAGDLIIPDLLQTEPPVPVDTYRDPFGNWCSRLIAPEGRLVLRTDALLHDTGLPDVVVPSVQQVPVEQLPDAVLMYLMGSRYCETDQLSDMAWLLFANGPTGWARVQAICEFVHHHIEFGYHHARRTRTALETYRERQGVCRDFAHLAIALCRCMNIPARYCTGYLGDIRSPVAPGPMDFAAWFEAYLGGHWYTFDARNNTPRIGRVLMARGRDACDVALANTFGPNTLQRFTVWAEEVTPSL